MTTKMLTDKRGSLSGVSADAIVRNAYGPGAALVEDAEGNQLIMSEDGKELDSVVEMHETDG